MKCPQCEKETDEKYKCQEIKPIEYHGSIQGVIHSLYKETKEPYIQVRELSTDKLVKCVFPVDLYPQIVHMLEIKDAAIHITGRAIASTEEKKIGYLYVQKVEMAECYIDGDLEKFFGCAPKITGDLSTQEFIDKVRNR